MDLPAHCLTLYRVRARFAETDLMGVIHHAAFLGYLEAGRIEYLRRRGMTYLSWAERGVHLAVVETWIRHRRPVFFDDVISVEVRLVELGRVKARFEYKLTVLRGATAELVAQGATLLACVDSVQKPRRIPPEAIFSLTEAETVGAELLG